MRITLTLVVLLSPTALAAGETRTWTDSSGKFKVEADLVGVSDDQVTLRRKDGRETTLPIARLSNNDQERVHLLVRGKKLIEFEKCGIAVWIPMNFEPREADITGAIASGIFVHPDEPVSLIVITTLQNYMETAPGVLPRMTEEGQELQSKQEISICGKRGMLYALRSENLKGVVMDKWVASFGDEKQVHAVVGTYPHESSEQYRDKFQSIVKNVVVLVDKDE